MDASAATQKASIFLAISQMFRTFVAIKRGYRAGTQGIDSPYERNYVAAFLPHNHAAEVRRKEPPKAVSPHAAERTELPNKKHIHMKRFVLPTIISLMMGWSVAGNAQTTTEDCHNAAKELITNNLKLNVSNALLLKGPDSQQCMTLFITAFGNLQTLQDTDIQTFEALSTAETGLQNLSSQLKLLVLPVKAQKKILQEYRQSPQYIDDVAAVFETFYPVHIDVAAVRKLTKDLPQAKAIVQLTYNPAIQQHFLKSAMMCINGEFPGFQMPECTESYKALFEQFYTLSNAQADFDASLKNIMDQPRYKPHSQQLQTYYQDNAKIFILRQCCKYLSEAEMEKCVAFLSNQPTTLDKIGTLSRENELKIVKAYTPYFKKWMQEHRAASYECAQELYSILTKGQTKMTKEDRKRMEELSEQINRVLTPVIQ